MQRAFTLSGGLHIQLRLAQAAGISKARCSWDSQGQVQLPVEARVSKWSTGSRLPHLGLTSPVGFPCSSNTSRHSTAVGGSAMASVGTHLALLSFLVAPVAESSVESDR